MSPLLTLAEGSARQQVPSWRFLSCWMIAATPQRSRPVPKRPLSQVAANLCVATMDANELHSGSEGSHGARGSRVSIGVNAYAAYRTSGLGLRVVGQRSGTPGAVSLRRRRLGDMCLHGWADSIPNGGRRGLRNFQTVNSVR